MLSIQERLTAYSLLAPALRRKAMRFASRRMRDLPHCEREDLAQDALGRHWEVCERLAAESRIASEADYLALCARVRLRYRRRHLGQPPSEPITPHVDFRALCELLGNMPERLSGVAMMVLARKSYSEIARTLFGSDNSRVVEEVRDIAALAEERARLILRLR